MLGILGASLGCATRQSTPTPPPTEAAPPRPSETCLLILGAMPSCCRLGPGVLRDLKAEVVRALHDSGGFRVLETELDFPLELTPANARGAAALAGASCVFLLRVQSFEVVERTHHVREYLDGTAAADLSLLRLPGGAVEGTASEVVQLAVRSRHGTFGGTRSVLARRLADLLVEKCLASR